MKQQRRLYILLSHLNHHQLQKQFNKQNGNSFIIKQNLTTGSILFNNKQQQFNTASYHSSSINLNENNLLNVRNYWQSLQQYIIDGNKDKLNETMNQFTTILTNLDKIEIPEDIANELIEIYFTKLNLEGKKRFFEIILIKFSGIPLSQIVLKKDLQKVNYFKKILEKVLLNLQNLEENEKSINNYLNSLQQLRNVLEPFYEKFLEIFIINRMRKSTNNKLSGLQFVIQLRQDLLNILKEDKNNLLLNDLNTNITRLLSSWFSPPFLECNELHWYTTTPEILEKIIFNEKVHPIGNFENLKKRLTGPNKKMFALFHSSMLDTPLVVLQVALMDHIAKDMREVFPLKEEEDKKVLVNNNTAIFYSICSAQGGLQGIELGNYLIKKVVNILQNTMPNITQFSTLSPIPGFMKWLITKLKIEISNDNLNEVGGTENVENKFHDEKLLKESEKKLLFEIAKENNYDNHHNNPYQILLNLIENTKEPLEKLKPIMMRLVTRYIYKEKRKGKALDPVTNFHIRNGATLERINWLGDLSSRRMKESYGIMVNYKYNLDQLEQNNHEYLVSGGKMIKIGNLFEREYLDE
ncbi:hypothetical protein ABK040_011753 [Willaertia magna]